ncbi:MAG TPA: hypothetical protein VEY91_05990, partial [Candidatus Limnocylindria bacterium]|nr:hypothetical protein [Candidatus Limnocylindria bacterium]
MVPTVFVAPYFMETTLRFVAAAAELPGVRLGLVSHDPEDKLPPGLRSRLAGHWRVDDSLNPTQLAGAVRGLAARLGPVQRLIGTLEELQVPLAEVRAALGIPGVSVEVAKNFRDKSRMKHVLRAAGLPCARHRLAESEHDAWAFAEEVGYPLVAKPPTGSGSHNTFRIDGPNRMREW